MLTDSEIKALLEIVKNDNPEMPLSGIDIPRLIRLAHRHKVAYQMLLFAQRNKEFFTSEQVEKLIVRNQKVARQSLVQLQQLKYIAGALEENHVGYVCIKGPQLSRMLYGREALKDSVDIDIMLVNAGDLLKVHNILKDLGYTRSNLNDYPGKWRRTIFLIAKREVHYHNPENKCSIDLHIRPGANTYLTEKNFTGFLSGLKIFDLEGTPIPVPEDEAYFVYLCYHGALHQFMRLAWLLDIRAFLKLKSGTMDFKRVSEIARSSRIERCVDLALLLLNDYFGDNFSGSTAYSIKQSERMNFLAGVCKMTLGSPPGYEMSIRGRFKKVVYIMKLLNGLPGKIDWIYGIIMRQIIKVIAKTQISV